MADQGIWILDPVGVPDVKPKHLAKRLEDLDNVRLGILWNEKPNGDILLRHIQESLQRKYKIQSVVWKTRGASTAASPKVLAELGKCDAVVNAIGD